MARLHAKLLPALAAVASFAASADAELDAVAARRLEAALGALQGFRAEFRQTVTDARGRLTEQAAGTVALARPGRFRWDYREPPQLIVSDGRTVWFYDVGLEQVTIRAAAETLAGTPSLLLSEQRDLQAEFTIRDGGAEEGLEWTILEPRGDETDFSELRVGLAAGELSRMTLLDRLGQTTRLEFGSVERNPPLEPGIFSFTPPPGVDVVGRAPTDTP